MSDAGYRTPSAVPACSRCRAAIDVARAVLSSEGLPLCPRCDAEARIGAASAPEPQPDPISPLVASAARRIPWNDAMVSLGVGAALFVGAPVCGLGMWRHWVSLDGTLAIYAIGMPVVVVTTVRALVHSSRARAAQRAAQPPAPLQVGAAGLPAGQSDAWAPAPGAPGHAQPQVHAAQRDAALASVGAGLAIGGCGAITVVLVLAALVALAVLLYLAWLFLTILGVIH